jgi:single-strand DNA-binding protein
MRNATEISIVGNLTADPEMRFTPSGAAVANFSVVVNNRRFDRQTNQWTDGEPTFWRCNIWRQYAENVMESLTRGMRVVVMGQIQTRSWEDRESGAKRTVNEILVDEVGPALAFATAKVVKVERKGGTPPASDDPWANVRGPQKPAGGPADDDEPPF